MTTTIPPTKTVAARAVGATKVYGTGEIELSVAVRIGARELEESPCGQMQHV